MALKRRAMGALAALWDVFPHGLRRQVLFATNHHFLVGVVGLVIDDEGRVLVLEHRFRTPWRWGLPGGFVNHEEPLSKAVERELYEEIGLAVVASDEAIDVEVSHKGRYLSIALPARLRGSAEMDLTKNPEIVGGGFYAPDDLPPDTYPHHRALIQRYADRRLHAATDLG